MAESFEWHSAEQNNPVNCFARGRQRNRYGSRFSKAERQRTALFKENKCLTPNFVRDIIYLKKVAKCQIL